MRVVPNRYPAMRIEGQLEWTPAGLYDRVTGIGAHEVIIETPDVKTALEDLTIGGMAEVFAAYKERILDLDKDSRFQHIYIFKNFGPTAGGLPRPRAFAVGGPPVGAPAGRGEAAPGPRPLRAQAAQPFQRHPPH